MPSILILEPDDCVRNNMLFALQNQLGKSNTIFAAADLEEAILYVKDYRPDAVLTVNTSAEGENTITALRNACSDIAIIALIDPNSGNPPAEIIRALESGASHAFTKPVHLGVMESSIMAALRDRAGIKQDIIEIGPFRYNFSPGRLSIIDEKGQEHDIEITEKEQQFLELMLRKQKNGEIVTKEMFLNRIYGGMDEPDLKIIDIYICKLRKKLAKAIAEHAPGQTFNGGQATPIATVWGRGYVISNKPDAPAGTLTHTHTSAATGPSHERDPSKSAQPEFTAAKNTNGTQPHDPAFAQGTAPQVK